MKEEKERITDKEMFVRESVAGHRPDEQGAEDISEVVTGCGQDKHEPGEAR